MNKLLIIGRWIFSIGIIALAVLCIISKDFIIGRPPASTSLPPVLVYLSSALLILAGIAILLHKRAKEAAFIIAIMILLLSFTRHLLHFMEDWLNTYKTLALVGGALIVATSYITNRKQVNNLLWVGTIPLSIFFIASGYAHIKFHDFVTNFIPAYIPFHVFFTYFTAVSLITGGIGILIPITRKWAALLSGIMLSGWILLLHIPRFLANINDPSDRMGLFESFTFAGIFFVLAAIFASLEKERVIENL